MHLLFLEIKITDVRLDARCPGNDLDYPSVPQRRVSVATLVARS